MLAAVEATLAVAADQVVEVEAATDKGHPSLLLNKMEAAVVAADGADAAEAAVRRAERPWWRRSGRGGPLRPACRGYGGR